MIIFNDFLKLKKLFIKDASLFCLFFCLVFIFSPFGVSFSSSKYYIEGEDHSFKLGTGYIPYKKGETPKKPSIIRTLSEEKRNSKILKSNGEEATYFEFDLQGEEPKLIGKSEYDKSKEEIIFLGDLPEGFKEVLKKMSVSFVEKMPEVVEASEKKAFSPLPTTGCEESLIGKNPLKIEKEVGIFPNTAVGLLHSFFYKCGSKDIALLGKGTAVMISPHCALTCGHNIRRRTRGDESDDELKDYSVGAGSLVFYPGFYGKNVYFEAAADVRVKVCQQWYFNQNENYDLGLLYFEKPIGLQTGYIKISHKNQEDLLDELLTITGYPAVSKGKGDFPHSSRGMITKDKNLSQVKYKQDTVKGISGAPIYMGKKYPECVGIHTKGSKPEDEYNSGVLITEEKYEIIERWLRQRGEISN